MDDHQLLKSLAEDFEKQFPFGDEPLSLKGVILIILWVLWKVNMLSVSDNATKQ